MDEKAVKFLVVDSSVLIKQAPVHELTNVAYSVHGVVNEIKDANTRNSLQVLPYEFKLREPNTDAYKFIVNFSRKTGDYSNLSAVDLQLLALTYQLCKENLTEDEFKHLKTEPKNPVKAPMPESAELKLSKPVNVAGFYVPPKKSNNKTTSESENESKQDENNNVDETETVATAVAELSVNEKAAEKKEEQEKEEQESGDEEEEEEEEDEEEDDGGEWITPGNIEEIKKMSQVDSDRLEVNESNRIKVGCMTSDFAMQNVLIQIGIPVLSVDGLIIKVARSYVLRCMTCMSITTNMEKKFCPKCGYKTLERVVVTVDSNGNKVYRGRRKQPKLTLNFSLPTPRGGKHPNYPILSEDQPCAHNYPSKKSLVKNDPLDPDYVYQASPFAIKDVYSRAARLGINPNKMNTRFVKRK